jgi:hypothetical protein
MNNSKMVPVEITLSEWKRFAKFLEGIVADLEKKAETLSFSNYIPVSGVNQKEGFQKRRIELMQAIKHKILLEAVVDKISQAVRKAIAAVESPRGQKTWHTNFTINKYETIINKQMTANLTVDDLDKPGVENTYAETYEESFSSEAEIFKDSGNGPVWPDIKKLAIGLPIRILNDEDIDFIKAEILKLRKGAFKNRNRKAVISRQTLKIEIPTEVAEYLPR